MERLLAWYRVGSSIGAVVALVVANAVPLLGVLFLGWNVWTILTIYWLENGVVGIFNVRKMAHAKGPDADGSDAKAGLVPFFIVHYGLFWLVHGVFVLSLPLFQSIAAGPGSIEVGPGFLSDPLGIVIAIVGLLISHGVSYRFNYIGRGEYLRTTASSQMFAPYGRLVVLHITIIFGAIAIGFTGAPIIAVVILVVLKTVLDLGLHLAEHRDDDRAAVSETAGPESVP